MVAQALISTLERQRQENHGKFDASLNYILSSELSSEPAPIPENRQQSEDWGKRLTEHDACCSSQQESFRAQGRQGLTTQIKYKKICYFTTLLALHSGGKMDVSLSFFLPTGKGCTKVHVSKDQREARK